MPNRFLNISSCFKYSCWSSRPSQAPKTTSNVVQTQPSRFIARTTVWCQLQSALSAPIVVATPPGESRVGVELATGSTDHNASEQSRALDQADDEFHEKDAHRQSQSEFSSRHSLQRYLVPRTRRDLVPAQKTEPKLDKKPRVRRVMTTNLERLIRRIVPTNLERPIRHIPYRYYKSITRRTASTIYRSLIRLEVLSDDVNFNHVHIGTVHEIAESEEPEIHGGVKMVSLRPLKNSIENHGQDIDLDDFSSSWSKRFAVIQYRTQTLEIWSTSEETSILSALDTRMGQEAILRRWLENSPRVRIREWENYLLLALQHNPGYALNALDIALSDPTIRVPKHTVDDSLAHLTKIYLEGVESPATFTVDMIIKIACNLAKASRLEDGQPSSIPPTTIYWVLRCCRNVQAIALYHILCGANIYIPPRVSLCFLERATKMGSTVFASEVLQHITACDMPPDLKASQFKFAELLRALIKSRDQNYNSKKIYWRQKTYLAQILAQIHRLGIRPDIISRDDTECGDEEWAHLCGDGSASA